MQNENLRAQVISQLYPQDNAVTGDSIEDVVSALQIGAVARISELGVQKYTFGVNLVSNSFSSHCIIHKKYGYWGVQNQQ